MSSSEVWRAAFFYNLIDFYFDGIYEFRYNSCLGYTQCFGFIEDLSYR